MIIYKITNLINLKFYIGKTERALDIRWREHLRRCQVRKNRFYSSLLKYGKENFKIEIMEQGIKTKKELNNREIYFINILCPEYNLTFGGEGASGYKHSEETKIKMRLKKIGYRPALSAREGVKKYWAGNHHKEETKLKIKKANIGRKGSMLNKKHSVEALGKMKTLGKKWRIAYGKPITQKHKNGNILGQWPSIIEASRSLGIDRRNITAAIKGKAKTGGGFNWEYAFPS